PVKEAQCHRGRPRGSRAHGLASRVERNEVTYLDTHIVVWLYDGEVSKLTKAAIDRIQEDELLVSPAVVLELQLLHEIKRVRPTAMRIIDQLSTDVGVSLCQLS